VVVKLFNYELKVLPLKCGKNGLTLYYIKSSYRRMQTCTSRWCSIPRAHHFLAAPKAHHNSTFPDSLCFCFQEIPTGSQVSVAHTCNSSYLGGWDLEDPGPGQPGQKVRAYLQNNQNRKDWRRVTSGTCLASTSALPEKIPLEPSVQAELPENSNQIKDLFLYIPSA
jgi:hypothetical protein